MNTERERFEKVYPCPHNVRFIESGNYYRPQEPYVWGGDTASANLNRQWETWQHQAATIADLQQQLDEANRRGEELESQLKVIKVAAVNYLARSVNYAGPENLQAKLDLVRAATATSKGGVNEHRR
jgi:hypothetical protein